MWGRNVKEHWSCLRKALFWKRRETRLERYQERFKDLAPSGPLIVILHHQKKKSHFRDATHSSMITPIMTISLGRHRCLWRIKSRRMRETVLWGGILEESRSPSFWMMRRKTRGEMLWTKIIIIRSMRVSIWRQLCLCFEQCSLEIMLIRGSTSRMMKLHFSELA